MRFLADVNIPQSVILYLSEVHDVLDLKMVNRTMSDNDVIVLAQTEQRIILTFDKDFISFMQYPRFQTATIVVRLSVLSPKNVISYLHQMLLEKPHLVERSLTIVYDDEAVFHTFVD